MSEHIKIIDGEVCKPKALDWADKLIDKGLVGGAVELVVRRHEEKRTLPQNDKQWPMLRDIAQQVKLNGRAHTEQDWKVILTSSYRPQKFVFGVDGSLVALSFSTSKAKKSEMKDLIEIYYAYGSECGVSWSEQSLKQYQSYREAQHG